MSIGALLWLFVRKKLPMPTRSNCLGTSAFDLDDTVEVLVRGVSTRQTEESRKSAKYVGRVELPLSRLVVEEVGIADFSEIDFFFFNHENLEPFERPGASVAGERESELNCCPTWLRAAWRLSSGPCFPSSSRSKYTSPNDWPLMVCISPKVPKPSGRVFS